MQNGESPCSFTAAKAGYKYSHRSRCEGVHTAIALPASKENGRYWQSGPVPLISIAVVVEAVCPVPAPTRAAQIRDIDSSLESGELSGPVRKCAESSGGCHIYSTTTECSVALPGVEDNVSVQEPYLQIGGLCVIDLCTRSNRPEIR